VFSEPVSVYPRAHLDDSPESIVSNSAMVADRQKVFVRRITMLMRRRKEAPQ
jgi:hypothetical protein